MKNIENQYYVGERPLFNAKELNIEKTIFNNGESPLKESSDITLKNTSFQWKYPLWYSNNVQVEDSNWLEMGRSGVWYTNHITINNTLIQAPKNFRRCKDVTLNNVYLPHALETFWNCHTIKLNNIQASGDYFGMNSENITINDFSFTGNYCFDGAKNIVVHNARMLSKDAFWNTENVVVYDSVIHGEYIGWNSKNMTFINCTIESLQGFCYIENLTLKNCTLLNTTLAFEYSSVDADIKGRVESIMNPNSGHIKADEIGQLIMNEDYIDPSHTTIDCPHIIERRKYADL